MLCLLYPQACNVSSQDSFKDTAYRCPCWNTGRKVGLPCSEIRRSVLLNMLAPVLILTDFLQEFCVHHKRTRIVANSRFAHGCVEVNSRRVRYRPAALWLSLESTRGQAFGGGVGWGGSSWSEAGVGTQPGLGGPPPSLTGSMRSHFLALILLAFG